MAGRIGAKGARGRTEKVGRVGRRVGRRVEKAGAGTEVESEGTAVFFRAAYPLTHNKGADRGD
jgi:hypothetical protein